MQWLVHFECYHYLRATYVKEITFLNIQTGTHFTNVIKLPLALYTTAEKLEQATYNLQCSRHGLPWEDGDMFWDEFVTLLRERVPRFRSEIYTLNHLVYKFLQFKSTQPWTFSNVQLIQRVPNQMVNDIPCNTKHSLSHCSEKRVLNALAYLRPALVPYYIPELVFDFEAYEKTCKELERVDSASIKYGEHRLAAPYFTSLSKVRLDNANSEHSLTGEFERATKLTADCDEDQPA